MHFEPTSSHGQGKEGTCGLCGIWGQLSETHVPPKKSGNENRMTRSGRNRNTSELVQSRPRRGLGIRGYFLCESCNRRTGVWDEEFIHFVRHARTFAFDHASGDFDALELSGEAPFCRGKVARSLLAGVFALSSGLHSEYPALAASVLSGEASEFPPELELSIALTFDTRFLAVHQRGGAAARSDGTLNTLPACIIHAPPLSAVFLDDVRGPVPPHASIRSWAAQDVSEVHGEAVMIPFVTLEAHRPRPIEAAAYRIGHSIDSLAQWRPET